MRKINENEAKPTKTSTRLVKGQKPEPGKKVIKESLKCHLKSAEIQKISIKGP